MSFENEEDFIEKIQSLNLIETSRNIIVREIEIRLSNIDQLSENEQTALVKALRKFKYLGAFVYPPNLISPNNQKAMGEILETGINAWCIKDSIDQQYNYYSERFHKRNEQDKEKQQRSFRNFAWISLFLSGLVLIRQTKLLFQSLARFQLSSVLVNAVLNFIYINIFSLIRKNYVNHAEMSYESLENSSINRSRGNKHSSIRSGMQKLADLSAKFYSQYTG